MIRPSTSLRSLGVRTGYLGFSDPPACILVRISSERVSWLTVSLSQYVLAPAVMVAGVRFNHSQDIRLDGGTGSLDALDNGLGELLDVTPGRVEGNGNDGLGPVRVSSAPDHGSTVVQSGSAAYILFSGEVDGTDKKRMESGAIVIKGPAYIPPASATGA